MIESREEKEAKANTFKQFSTMTYGVSLYLQSPLAYEEMMLTGKKDVTGLELLVQSGGINNDPDGKGNFGAKRNRHFPQDFYLDDVQINSYISGTATGGPLNSFGVNFTVTEPAGVTFLERLYNAATDFATRHDFDGSNPVNQIYLMVIRFYGYDDKGLPVINGKFEDGSDTESYLEKWIPIQITSVKFSIETSKVVYSCETVCPQTQVANGQMHGIIPFNVALQGGTVKELLSGKEQHNASGIVSGGLMAALNSAQQKLVGDGTYEEADTYSIEFEEGSGLAEATLAPAGSTTVIERGAMPGTAAAQDTSKFSTGSAKSPGGKSAGKQTFATNAGMKIAKFIDIAIRSSSFISSQYKKVNDGNKKGSTQKYTQRDTNKPLMWFKINPRISIKDKKYDKKRKSVVYHITYYVSTYEVRTVDTRDFNSQDCYVPQKYYDFWFTGENTEVLDFRQDYNTLYFTTFSSKHLEDPGEEAGQQVNARLGQGLTAPSVYRPGSTEKGAGENLTDEQAANAASILYAPQDIVNAEIDIVGDPDWIAQSELFYSPTTTPDKAPTLSDGSINYDIAEVFFAVNFNTVVDYDLNTGLADTTAKNFSRDDASTDGTLSQYSFIYRANMITTQLAAGKFVQQLQGTLVYVPEKCVTGNDSAVREDTKPDKTVKSAKPTTLPAPGNSLKTAPQVRVDLDHAAKNVVTDEIFKALPLSGAAAREQFDPILNNIRNKGK